MSFSPSTVTERSGQNCRKHISATFEATRAERRNEDGPADLGAIFAFPLQGSDQVRHLIVVKVPDLAQALRDLPARGARLEHIHDY